MLIVTPVAWAALHETPIRGVSSQSAVEGTLTEVNAGTGVVVVVVAGVLVVVVDDVVVDDVVVDDVVVLDGVDAEGAAVVLVVPTEAGERSVFPVRAAVRAPAPSPASRATTPRPATRPPRPRLRPGGRLVGGPMPSGPDGSGVVDIGRRRYRSPTRRTGRPASPASRRQAVEPSTLTASGVTLSAASARARTDSA